MEQSGITYYDNNIDPDLSDSNLMVKQVQSKLYNHKSLTKLNTSCIESQDYLDCLELA